MLASQILLAMLWSFEQCTISLLAIAKNYGYSLSDERSVVDRHIYHMVHVAKFGVFVNVGSKLILAI